MVNMVNLEKPGRNDVHCSSPTPPKNNNNNNNNNNKTKQSVPENTTQLARADSDYSLKELEIFLHIQTRERWKASEKLNK